MSTASLALTEQTTAHSGHSHLRDNVQKEKIKRRSSVASLFLNRGKDKTKDKEEDKEDGNKKRAWLLRLNQKKNKYMDRLLRVGDDEKQGEMKWDDFLKVMHDMGFGYDSSTAGSSVRFDPPVKGDRSITFHMPHPRHTLSHKQVKEFGKKLKKYYGWDEDLLKQAAAAP
ncbi:hypothetical protein K503DRAFT_781258 [Rhizopogon vinicolor AM-OR11-026]|uniref:Type II toxin-antitoxin system HicA family toxin n=1 Tax=Rhizopogon vinicolor AM-OR11-026 TaxID=1314800 RepID=A0A1B7N6Z0_9AGAM|nr:hypothetical protein K503DRAFT_781258 [Rhizopogon vinicolor AM-OR11-026]